MQRFEYSKPGRHLGQICDQILAAVPTLVRVDSNGDRIARFMVDDGGQADGIRVFVPDGVRKATIDAVIAAHTPAPPAPDPADVALAALKSATTIAQVKSALLALLGKE